MGFLDNLLKRKKETLPDFDIDSSKIKRALSEQKEWIDYLHNSVTQLYGHAKYIHESHHAHKSNTENNIVNINKWIDHLAESNRKLENEIDNMESRLKKDIKSELQRYHKDILLTISSHAAMLPSKEMIKRELLADLKAELQDIIEVSSKPVEPETLTQEPITQNKSVELNSGERELLNFLFNQDSPMPYEDISRKTGKSLNTIRVYMNSLKSKKDLIEEVKTPRGKKLFGIKGKEKAKKLYNFN